MNKGLIVVTGGSGFIGKVIVNKLVSYGYSIINISRESQEGKNGVTRTLTWDQLDTHLVKLETKPLAIIHCSTHYGRGDEGYSEAVYGNIFLPVKLLDFASSIGVKRFVNVDSYYTKKENIFSKFPQYCITKNTFKKIGEEKSIQNGISFLTGRLEHVYGPGDKNKFIPWLINCIKENKQEINLTECTQVRDFIYVDDAANALIKMALDVEVPRQKKYEIEIGTGVETSLKDFIYLLLKKADRQDIEVNFGAIAMAEDEIMNSKSCMNAFDLMGWKAEIALENGLEKTVRAEFGY